MQMRDNSGLEQPARRFPAPWSVEDIPGGLRVVDGAGQAVAYVYAESDRTRRDVEKRLSPDEARRIALGIARLPELLGSRRAD